MAKPEIFENDDYRIEYHTRDSEDERFQYRVFDKKNNKQAELQIRVNEERYNLDGKCKLTFIEENNEPIYLSAFRPSLARRVGDTTWGPQIPEVDKYKGEPLIGGHRPIHPDGRYHYVKEIDDVMSIYRALKKGDFEVESFPWLKKESKNEYIEKVLKFMDSYIFNTEESKAVLNEYMHKNPLPLKEEDPSKEAAKEKILANKERKKTADSHLSKLRKMMTKKIDNVLGTSSRKTAKKIPDNLFDNVKE